MKLTWLRTIVVGAALAVAMSAYTQGADMGASQPSQAAADCLRTFAGTDGAFMAAGLVKDSFAKENLSSLLQYPTDEVIVIGLTGDQLTQAFERSASLYPQPNSSFLQVSGFEITFNRQAPVGSRIVSVTADGHAVDPKHTYLIAMPSSLGRGGLGYFKIWDKSKIVKTFDQVTIESVLKDKPFVETPLRWITQAS